MADLIKFLEQICTGMRYEQSISEEESTIMCFVYPLRIIAWLDVEPKLFDGGPRGSTPVYAPGTETPQVYMPREPTTDIEKVSSKARQKCGKVAQQ